MRQLKNLLIAGILAGLVILVIQQIISLITQSLFSYNVLSLGGMRSANDPVMSLYFVYPFVLAFCLAFAYRYFEKAMKGKLLDRGMGFGVVAFMMFGIPSWFIVFSSMDYPAAFSIYSLLANFLSLIAAGIVIAKFAD